jgi:hypothetical protein
MGLTGVDNKCRAIRNTREIAIPAVPTTISNFRISMIAARDKFVKIFIPIFAKYLEICTRYRDWHTFGAHFTGSGLSVKDNFGPLAFRKPPSTTLPALSSNQLFLNLIEARQYSCIQVSRLKLWLPICFKK